MHSKNKAGIETVKTFYAKHTTALTQHYTNIEVVNTMNQIKATAGGQISGTIAGTGC